MFLLIITIKKVLQTNITPLTSTQMRVEGNFVGFDFDSIWNPPTGSGFPKLKDI